MGLGGILLLVAMVCGIIILIDAFKSAVWKGILGIFCGFYLIYYALVEYQADNKWLIVGAWLGCAVLGDVLFMMGGGMANAIPRH